MQVCNDSQEDGGHEEPQDSCYPLLLLLSQDFWLTERENVSGIREKGDVPPTLWKGTHQHRGPSSLDIPDQQFLSSWPTLGCALRKMNSTAIPESWRRRAHIENAIRTHKQMHGLQRRKPTLNVRMCSQPTCWTMFSIFQISYFINCAFLFC